MLTFLQLFYIFSVFYKKGIFAKETCFWQSIRRFTLLNYFSVKKNIKSHNQNYTVVFIQKKNFLLYLFGNGEIQIQIKSPPKENKKLT